MDVYFYEPEHHDDGEYLCMLNWPVLPQIGGNVKLKKMYVVVDICITQPMSGVTGELYTSSSPHFHVYLGNPPAKELVEG